MVYRPAAFLSFKNYYRNRFIFQMILVVDLPKCGCFFLRSYMSPFPPLSNPQATTGASSDLVVKWTTSWMWAPFKLSISQSHFTGMKMLGLCKFGTPMITIYSSTSSHNWIGAFCWLLSPPIPAWKTNITSSLSSAYMLLGIWALLSSTVEAHIYKLMFSYCVF